MMPPTMEPRAHALRHAYQPTNTSCGQTCLSMLLSHFGTEQTPQEILTAKDVYRTDDGHEWGTMAADLAAHCIPLGFTADVHTFDCRIIDHSWSELSRDALIARLESVKTSGHVPTLGKNISGIFIRSYIDFLKSGGSLHIAPYVTSRMLYALLEKGPLQVTVCMGAFYGFGKQRLNENSQPVPDDLHGGIGTHFVVVYGNDADGNFLIADPSKKPGLYTVEPERLTGAIMAAQRDCENIVFQISK